MARSMGERLMMKLHIRGQQHPISKAEGGKFSSKQLVGKTIADDELREASIRQRVRELEHKLFDEYWDELGAVKD